MIFHLVGSGPSAQGVQVPDDAMLACVNGSYDCVPLRDPDVYLVGELQAAQVYAPMVAHLVRQGLHVYMRPGAVQRYFEQGLHPGVNWQNQRLVRPVDFRFGPPSLWHLHGDPPNWPRGQGRPPWLTSGILLLWVICESYRPRRVVVHGLDGYPGDGEPGEYAPDVRALASKPLRTDPWVRATAQLMQRGVDAISNHYKGVNIHFPVRPNYWSPTWRATYGDQA